MIDKNVKHPRKTREVKPSYPDVPPGTVGSGMWLGELLLGIDGKVAQVWTLREIHFVPPFPAFNAAIVEALRQWEFDPVVVESKPTPTCITASVIVDWQ